MGKMVSVVTPPRAWGGKGGRIGIWLRDVLLLSQPFSHSAAPPCPQLATYLERTSQIDVMGLRPWPVNALDNSFLSFPLFEQLS